MPDKRVLVVEDDPDVRLGYEVMLKAYGYDIFLASDGLAAVSEALEQRPDVMLLDLGLPLADGFSVLAKFRDDHYLSSIPVIVLSGHDGTKERALAAGARAHFYKPWNDAELLTTISELLGQTEVPIPARRSDVAAQPQQPDAVTQDRATMSRL